jgi:tetratricopeptide (TPR) repeat protein
MVLRAHDFEAECVQALREAERLDPTDPRWPYLQGLTLLLARPDDGIACLRRAVDRSRADRPEPRLRLAEALFDRGQADEAESFARSVGEANPRAAMVLARVSSARGNWADVLRLIEPHRDDPACQKKAALFRGQAFCRTGRQEEGEAELRRAAQLPEDALFDDEYVLEVMRLQVGHAAELSESSELMANGRAAEAVPILEPAVRRSPGAVEPRLLLGRSLLLANDAAAARRELLLLTKSHPESVDGWFHLGVAELTLGDPAAAAAAFTTVVRLKPDHALGYFNLGHARKRMGDRAGAIAAFEQALVCRPDHEPSRILLKELREGR